MPTIAPWINVSPRDFLAAGERGLALREESQANSARVGAELAGISQRASAAAAAQGLERERLAQTERLSQMEMQARQEQAQRDFLLRQQQENILNAYRQAEIGLRKDELNRADAANAKTLDARIGFAKDVQGGMSPDQALLRHPELIGGGAASVMAQGKMSGQDKFSPVESSQLRTLQTELGAALRNSLEADPQSDPNVKNIQSQIQAIYARHTQPQGATGTTAPIGGVKFRFNAKTGTWDDLSAPAGAGASGRNVISNDVGTLEF